MNDPALHNTLPPNQNDGGEDKAASSGNASTAIPSTETSSSAGADGTWGEREAGGPVDTREAMEEYEALRRELTHLSHSQSKREHEKLHRVPTSRSRKSVETGAVSKQTTINGDLEAGDQPQADDEFALAPFLREGHFEKRTDAGDSAKKVGVTFTNLTVKGIGVSTASAKTLPEAILGTFGPDLYRLVSRFVPALNFSKVPPLKTLINDFTGVARPGEMVLVLGRPGSGCTTFLKAIANKRGEFASVTGDVSYGGISAEEQSAHYRGEVSYNPEDDLHLPTLNVHQTLKFSLMNKTKRRNKGEIDIIVDALMKMFGISHTAKTLVGDALIRGISGGERKRVSIAETLATKSTVVCWDNSTRGLDASTALDFAKSLRIMTDISNRTTFVTLYQAGEQIYDLMDKVIVIDEGRMLYQGSASEAKQYFVDLGLYCPDRETTADFLTSVTDPAQRTFREGYEASAPKTAEEFERAFIQSAAHQKVLADVAGYQQYLQDTDHSDAKAFQQSVKEQQSKYVPNKSNFTVSYWRQVLACTQREFWLFWGDRTAIYTKFFIIVSNGLIVASLFYKQSGNTSGAFSRGGTLLFGTLFLGWLQLGELLKAVSGRAVIARHKEYAFYRPSAVCLGRALADFPILFAQVLPFSIIIYFLAGLDVDVSKYFIFLLFSYTMTYCITALYRMFAALSPTINDAVRFSGIGLNLLIVFTGYVITRPYLLHQKIWFGWIFWINPLAYCFEGVVSNEFSHRIMECAPESLVPQGPGVTAPYQGCAFQGTEVGSTSITGERYLANNYS